ncbi:SpaA isopeptide-forming pilin-related protein [Peptoniphilus senegalensis]|uniref:SpaA isopeptide-forming pilin-related protein n=1 Tax=Peptoniphilus senegalensis TaxID=1465757 RepID=UPI0003069983|nr:SpaA isopeptide-forming pilin-related protein [Peptoniphilus senegalensis]
MKDISRRIISLILALLMVLEVFSPVAVSAALLPEASQNSENDGGYQSKTSILVGPSDDSNSRKENETKVLEVPAKKQVEQEKQANQKSTDRQNNKIQEEKASGSLFEEKALVEEKRDKALIEEGTKREKEAEARLEEALRESQEAERKARASEIANQDFAQETIQSGYKSWRVKNKVKALYSGGKIDCQGLLIEVEDFNGKKKTLTYDDILKDKNIIVNKEIKEGLFAPSGKLTLSTTGLKDIEIKIEFDKSVNKSDLSLEKENSNKLENDIKEEEKEGVLDKIKNFFADEETKGLEEDARGEDAKLELDDLGTGVKREVQLTEEEMEAGLQIAEMPTAESELEQESSIFRMFRAVRANGSPLENKKFTIRTRFDTSTRQGPIRVGQYFDLHLDEKLTVKNPSSLLPIKFNGTTIATPTYDEATNTIRYKIVTEIDENINLPVNIDVDYNIEKIPPEKNFTVVNRVSGLGVEKPKSLLPVVVDKNGNTVNTIIEQGRDDVIKIIDDKKDQNYQVPIDVYADPVIEDSKLTGFNWTVRVHSDTDLQALGYHLNLTTVKGSGLGQIEKVKLNNQDVTLDNNDIIGQLGIVDSKHHTLTESTRDLLYNFYTKVDNVQGNYLIDITVYLTAKDKAGAVRYNFEKGFTQEAINEATPTRVGVNNRTTIQGKFLANDKAQWTITDGISSPDEKNNNGMPLENRVIGGEQSIESRRMEVYGLDKTTGKMVVKEAQKLLNNMPTKESDPAGTQDVGNIAVYEFDTSLKNATVANDYNVSGVRISKFRNLYIDEIWSLPDPQLKMPAQTFKAVDDIGNEIGSVTVDEGAEGVRERYVTIPNARYWDINEQNGEATKRGHKIIQEFNPTQVELNGKTYTYNENANYHNNYLKVHYIQNSAIDVTEGKPVSFKVIKVDSKDPNKKLEGARYRLLGNQSTDVTTNEKGEAAFINVTPGEYTLKETKAPTGYKLDEELKFISVSQDGKIRVTGKNAVLSLGAGKTETVENDRSSSWPDYMNSMHYGKVDENGNVEFYIYLKPIAPRQGGQTDRNTRLNISIPGANVTDVEAYDVGKWQRETVKSAMEAQNVEQKIFELGDNVINRANKNRITGAPNTTDPFTNTTGYQIYFPKERFADDWGFLVRVKTNIGAADSTNVYYEWLTNEDTQNQTKLVANASVEKAQAGQQDEQIPTITITNDEFEKSSIEVIKFGDTYTQDKKRVRLPGAQFVLIDSEGNEIANKFTDEDGKADFGKHAPGKYYIREVTAPDGYKKSDVYFEVTVDEAGQVKYKAKFESSSGKPQNGEDYYIEKGEAIGPEIKTKIVDVKQRLEIQENEPGDIGVKKGVWEAYRFESLKYHADITVQAVNPGSKFEIQFDRNLDFTQYFGDFPKIKNAKGVDIAEPYFNYNTNLLTYVFNKNTEPNSTTVASFNLRGIIPNKYYARNSGNYEFTVTVEPGQTGVTGEQTITKTITADYENYDQAWGESQFYYFRDVYKGGDGQWYLTVMSYLNPLGQNTYPSKTLQYNWMTTRYQGDTSIAEWSGNGQWPVYKLEDIKVYRTEHRSHKVGEVTNNDNLPLSAGVRPEQDPYTYNLLLHEQINPDSYLRRSYNGFTLTYDPNQISNSGKVSAHSPLTIQTAPLSGKDGYLIEQTFKITDIDKFNSTWRLFYMSSGKRLRSAFASRANVNKAIAEQTEGEIPKYYKERIGLINEKYTPGNFKITKLNEANRNEKLPNATFALTDENGRTIYRTSDANGEINFTNIAPGRYTLKETKAPENFTLSNKEWQVTVFDDGNVRIREAGVTSSGASVYGKDLNISVTNKPTGKEFVVYKKDDKGQPLQGAKFKLTKQDGTLVEEVESDGNGIVKFTNNLTEGETYILEETLPPTGYKPLNKKWVIKVEDGKTKVYNYSESTGKEIKSILGEDGTEWVDVKNRITAGWNHYDNRWTGWAGNNEEARYLGTRIVAVNKTKKYAIQRFVINPESANIAETTIASIHREKPRDPNMTWYNGNAEYKIFTLDKPVTGLISDIRLADYNITDITAQVKSETEKSNYEPDRLKLTLPPMTTPIVIDVKVPYDSEEGGVGLGLDWLRGGNQIYWKSDFYEKVSYIKTTGPTKTQQGSIIGSYITEDSLDVTNEAKRFGFKLKKVKQGTEKSPIEGATFTLTGPNPLKDERLMTTKEDGTISFENLEKGTYTLVEKQAAPGYEKANTTWTVRITDTGKVFIKDNKLNPAGTALNAELSIADDTNTGANRSAKETVEKQTRMLKSALYGSSLKGKENSIVFKSEAEKKEDSVREKLNTIYGTEEFDKLYPNGISIKEMAMAAYTAPTTFDDGLEISDETVPAAQRGTDDLEQVSPYNIDSSNANISVSAGEVNTTDGSRDIKVKITPKTQQVGQNKSHWVLLVDRSKDFSGKNNLDNNINKFLTDLRTKADTPGAEVYISMIEYSATNNMNKLLVSKRNIKDFDNSATQYSYTMGTLEELPNSQYNLNEQNVTVRDYLSAVGIDRRNTNISDGAVNLENTVRANLDNLTNEAYDNKYAINFAAFNINNAVRNATGGDGYKKFRQFESMWAFYTKGYKRVYIHTDQESTELTGTKSDFANYINGNADYKKLYLTAKGKLKYNNKWIKPREVGPYVQKDILDPILNDTNNFASQGKEESLLKNGILNIATNDKVKLNSYSISKNGKVTENQTNPTTNSISKNISLGVGESLELDYKISLDQNAENNTEYTIHNLMTYKPDENAQAVNLDTMPLKTKKVGAAQKQYDVVIATLFNGKITANKSKANAGETITLTIKPDTGYKLDTLKYTDEDGIEHDIVGNSFTMPASNILIGAIFKKENQPQPTKHKIYTNPNGNGRIEVDKTEATEGEKVTFTLIPDAGNTITSLSVRTGSGEVTIIDGNYFIMPDADVSINATFKPSQQSGYSITIDPNIKNGQVTANQTIARKDTLITLNVVPDHGYELSAIKVTDAAGNNIDVDMQNKTFKMPASNVTVTATFRNPNDDTPGQGEIEITEGKLAQITNKQTGLDFKLFKRDLPGRKLPGAVFELVKTDKTYTTVDEGFGTLKGVSDEDGKVVFKNADGKVVNLGIGYYKITETNAPLGYKEEKTPWLVEVYEEKGQLKARYKGPDETPTTYVNSDKSKDTTSTNLATKDGIKYKSRITYINKEAKSFIQRIYIDTTAIRDTLNVQIIPQIKREEKDTPNKSPETLKEGVKTAYRSTYKLAKGTADEHELDEILRYHDLSKPDVSTVNTARWRPFNWGFDEDQLNLPPGVYFIDIEGFYDNKITKDDIGKIELNFEFYRGERKFQQAKGWNNAGEIIWEDVKNGTYQQGNLNLGYTAFNQSSTGQLGRTGGRIYPSLDQGKYTTIKTSVDIKPLYSAGKITEIDQGGLTVINDEETYNVTFSKHGRDDPNEPIGGEAVTKRRLEGAIFKLQKRVGNDYEDVKGSYIGSAFNGYFGFRGLKPGRYRLMEVKPPEGYKPIKEPVLFFTIETVSLISGQIVHPITGERISIDKVDFLFPQEGDPGYQSPGYKFGELKTRDVNGKEILLKDARNANLDTTKIINPKGGEVLLNKMKIQFPKTKVTKPGEPEPEEKTIFNITEIQITPTSNGYISLEYDKGNGIYQYVPEKSSSEKDGKLIDYVTSATAKNMGKIINEKPGKGSLTLNKVDETGTNITRTGLEPGARFKLTNTSSGSITFGTVGEDGTLKFEGLNLGTYKLQEETPPNGHINTGQVWHFTVGGKDLDPYQGEIKPTGSDLSDKITLESSEMHIERPDPDDKTGKTEKDSVVRPHSGHSLVFKNKFKLGKDIKINPGDYFVLKLSDSLSVNGIFPTGLDNLDIFADGVGTIAKANYDKEKGTITYTFTEYANAYNLVNFSNEISTFIDLYKVRNSTRNVDVGFGINNDTTKHTTVDVVYDLGKAEAGTAGQNMLNLASKIVYYNPETGEFVHYFYVNRKRQPASKFNFVYSSDQNLENVKVDYFLLKDNSQVNLPDDMPESFGVNEESVNYNKPVTIRAYSQLRNWEQISTRHYEGIATSDSYIYKVTGRVSDQNKSKYIGQGRLQATQDYYVNRYDSVYGFENQAVAKAELTIQAVNPSNKITFKKVDPKGNPLEGASFTLNLKDENGNFNDYQGGVQRSGKDGSFEFGKLKSGEYQLIEVTAPEGYHKQTGSLLNFRVSESGKIFKKVTITKEDGKEEIVEVEVTGNIPIVIENTKEQEIEFKKIDATTKEALAGAEFEVWYKKNAGDEYSKELVKMYQDNNGNKLVLNKDEKAPSGYTEVTKFTSGADGIVKFKFYDQGYYAIKEIKAPKGYIKQRDFLKEFRVLNGKAQTLEKSSKQGSVQTDNNIISSQTIEINEKDKTFKQRIILNPNQNEWRFDGGDTQLRLYENQWTVNTEGKKIRYAVLDENKSISDLKEGDFKDFNPRNSSANPLMYAVARMYGESNYTKPSSTNSEIYTNKSLVVEFTGNIGNSATSPISIKMDVNSDQWKYSELTYSLDYDKIGKEDKIYVDYQSTDPIQVENHKAEYPWTGGMGTLVFTVTGLVLMTAAVYVYSRKRRASYDE